jgi:hypothetical protein
MNCRTFVRLIRPYLRAEFEGVLGNEFRWHKHFCNSCRKAYLAAQTPSNGKYRNMREFLSRREPEDAA